MKRNLLSIVAVLAFSTSAMAFELVGKNESVVVYGAITNLDQADYFIGTHDYPDVPTAGHTGTKEDAGFSITIGLEEKVENGKLGSRKTLAFYNDGTYTTGDGNYYEQFTGYGVEASYDVFYQLNSYFKPYMGIGLGMNYGTSKATKLNNVTRVEVWSASGDSQDMTGIVKLGVTGDIIAGIQYFIDYKYRAGGESSVVAIGTVSTDLPNAVKHQTLSLGFGYKF